MSTQSAESIPASPVIAVSASDDISAEVRETATRLGVVQYLPQVIDLTREIYGGFSDVIDLTTRKSPRTRTSFSKSR